MTNGNGKDKIIEKIQKILALAGNNPSEGEAAKAAAKAQAMLAEHNLSMADVAPEKQKLEMQIDYELRTDSRPWRRKVATMTAKMYFCEYYFQYVKKPLPNDPTGKKYRRFDIHLFLGEKHNITVTKLMFAYLHTTVTRLAKEAAKRVPEKERTAFVNSFQHSCANRLAWRIQEKIDEAKRGGLKTDSGNTLPALNNLYADAAAKLKAFKEQTDFEVGKPEKAKAKSNHAGGMVAGDRAGRDISLDPQITQREKASAMIK